LACEPSRLDTLNEELRLARQANEAQHQQLAAALAAIKVKDELIKMCSGIQVGYLKDALAIQPDDSALREWLGEPVAWMNIDPQGGALFFRNDVCHAATTPLYAPKGMK